MIFALLQLNPAQPVSSTPILALPVLVYGLVAHLKVFTIYNSGAADFPFPPLLSPRNTAAAQAAAQAVEQQRNQPSNFAAAQAAAQQHCRFLF